MLAVDLECTLYFPKIEVGLGRSIFPPAYPYLDSRLGCLEIFIVGPRIVLQVKYQPLLALSYSYPPTSPDYRAALLKERPLTLRPNPKAALQHQRIRHR